MEGMRDVALAHYENLGGKEKAEIHNDFKRETANGRVSEYIKRKYESYSEEVDAWLQTCEGYQQGSLDFNDFITIKYIIDSVVTPRCNGCTSLILEPHFSCLECYIDPYSEDTYDFCTACYRSKKFEAHNHQIFLNGQTIKYLSAQDLAKKIRELKGIDELGEISRSNESAGGEETKPTESADQEETKSTESAEEETKSSESGEEETNSTDSEAMSLPETEGVDHRIDLLGETATVVPRRIQNISSFGNPNSSHPESDQEKNSGDMSFQRFPRRIDLFGENASVTDKPKSSF